MGCDLSSLKPSKPEKEADGKAKKGTKSTDKGSKKEGKDGHRSTSSKSSEQNSLDIPIPGKPGDERASSKTNRKEDHELIRKDKSDDEDIQVDVEPAVKTRASAASRGGAEAGPEAAYARSASHRSVARGTSVAHTPSPKRPLEELKLDITALEEDDDGISSSSSAPQLFRISPTDRVDAEEGSWPWWMAQVRRERVSKDGASRNRLQDLRNRLLCQHDEEPTDVELDLARCYMERTAPYILGSLFASLSVKEIRWVTSLRLDGNYLTDHGLGSMLTTMSQANEKRTVMPLLEQLYLNSMNLDRQSLVGILYFLFPVDAKQEQRVSRRLGPMPELTADFAPRTKQPPTVPLFPSLSILSLSDNPGLGTAGLAAMLRWFLATHLEPHVLSALDLSRCGMDRAAERVMGQYFTELPVAITEGRNPVMPRSLVLLGNRHGIKQEEDVNAPDEIRLVL